MKFRNLVVIVIILLILTEVFLRLFISKPSSQQYDMELGYTNIPGSKMIESMEGYSHVTFNKSGFNDADPDINLPRKIFVIGDSYTEATQLDYTLGYTSLMEQALSVSGVDIIKLARDSFLPLHYPVISRRYYSQYQPELTILQLGSHTLGGLYDGGISIKYSPDNEILNYSLQVSENDLNKEKFRAIINNSALAYYLMRRYKYLIIKSLNRFNRLFNNIKKVSSTPDQTAIDDSMLFRESRVEDQRRLTYILKRLKGKVVVVYFPDPGVIFDINEHNDRVREVIKASSRVAGAGFIDFTNVFRDDFAKNGRLLNGFSNSRPNSGHLNQYGHRVVSTHLITELKKSGYLN